MRKLLAVMAGCLWIVSILLTARYGFKQADEEIDRWIAAVMFGSISLCAFVFDALAVKLWFRGACKSGGFIGVIAALAFVVTFGNSLGGIVSRADAVMAQRQGVTDSRADNRRELKRLEDALANLGRFVPTDAEAVKAAKRAADAATASKQAECDKRGPLCKQWERDEASAAATLATVTSAKATSDRARGLEAQVEAVKARLNKPSADVVGHANPLGNALANMLGAGADVLTSWQQAIIALVFELCLVGMMVGFAVLGEVATVEKPANDDAPPENKPAPKVSPEPAPQPAPSRQPARLAVVAKVPPAALTRRLQGMTEKAPRKRLDVEDVLYDAYATQVCTEGEEPPSLAQFLIDVLAYCDHLGIKTAMINGKAYMVGVQLVAMDGRTPWRAARQASGVDRLPVK